VTPETLLYRQVHPSWVRNGRVTSQAFHPTTKDNNRLSAYDGDQITPEDAWNHYTSVLEFKSTGVIAISVEDCEDQELSVESDPQPDFLQHVLIDFSGLATNKMKRVARRLSRLAGSRGWVFRVSVD
jgi:hypothetical protein